MVIRKAIVALASVGLVFGSTAAAAAPVAADEARVSSPVDGAENLRGSWGWILAVIIIAGVIGVIASDSSETLPVSP